MEKKSIIVLGGGIMGMSAAYQLLSLKDQPYSVTIISEFFSPSTLSDKSVGLWGPYLPGVDSKTKDYEKIIRWGNETKKELIRQKQESLHNKFQIYTSQNWFMSTTPQFPLAEACPYSSIVDEMEVVNSDENNKNSNNKESNNIPFGPYKSALRYSSPLLITYRYLKQLTQIVENLGCNLVRKRVDNFEDFINSYPEKVDLIINCTGLGSRVLANDDSVNPIRGVLVKYPPVPEHMCTAYEGFSETEFTYIVFRPDCTFLGGTAIVGDYTKQNSEEEVKRIIERCTKIIPILSKYEIVSDWSGLRPGRPFVRLEIDYNLLSTHKIPIVHNYGHGGAGWSLFHGCTNDVMKLVKQHFDENMNKKSKL